MPVARSATGTGPFRKVFDDTAPSTLTRLSSGVPDASVIEGDHHEPEAAIF